MITSINPTIKGNKFHLPTLKRNTYFDSRWSLDNKIPFLTEVINFKDVCSLALKKLFQLLIITIYSTFLLLKKLFR